MIYLICERCDQHWEACYDGGRQHVLAEKNVTDRAPSHQMVGMPTVFLHHSNVGDTYCIILSFSGYPFSFVQNQSLWVRYRTPTL